jgi:hypothetical protein
MWPPQLQGRIQLLGCRRVGIQIGVRVSSTTQPPARREWRLAKDAALWIKSSEIGSIQTMLAGVLSKSEVAKD